MKSNKAIITLLVTSVLWLALVLGCSYLKKGTPSPSSSSGGDSTGAKDYFPLRVEIRGSINPQPRTGGNLSSV